MVQPGMHTAIRIPGQAEERSRRRSHSSRLGNPETLDQMNGWVSGKTRGTIKSIVESLAPRTILVAINAVYFKDLWVKPFEPRLTREDLFHTSDGRSVKIPLMSQHGSYPYYEESGSKPCASAIRTPAWQCTSSCPPKHRAFNNSKRT